MQYKNCLLVGNGISQLIGGLSWQEFLKEITNGFNFHKDAPMPLQADLFIEKKLSIIIEEKEKILFKDVNYSEYKEQIELIKQLINLNVSDILTTNYSYEIECIAMSKNNLSRQNSYRLNKKTAYVNRADAKYLLHTFKSIETNKGKKRIWHIHGEQNKRSSLIIGNNNYTVLSSRIVSYCKSIRKNKSFDTEEWRSWIDCFMLDNLHILGFGYDFSEIDLWWLLLQKRFYPNHGNTYYYTNKKESAVVDLLKRAGVSIIYIHKTDYFSFYKKALMEIKNNIAS